MSRHSKIKKRETEADRIYKSRLVGKLINRVMKDGKKSVAQDLVYKTLQSLGKNGEALEVFEKAVQNVGPKQEIKSRRVGGASYQIPLDVRPERRTSLAIRWIIAAAKARSNKEYHTFDEKLSAEIKDASENKGEAIKKRDTIQRMAEANKAFSHFRF